MKKHAHTPLKLPELSVHRCINLGYLASLLIHHSKIGGPEGREVVEA
ncbi:hypothetical protein [uncultured Nostoc sp.]